MNFLLDHDVPDVVAELLRHWDHHTSLLRQILPVATPDEQVFAYAVQHELVLVTCNRNDFLRLAEVSVNHSGLIVLIRRRTRPLECARLRHLLETAGQEGLNGNINFA